MELVDCPICSRKVPLFRMNQHIDSGCADSGVLSKPASVKQTLTKPATVTQSNKPAVNAFSKLLDHNTHQPNGLRSTNLEPFGTSLGKRQVTDVKASDSDPLMKHQKLDNSSTHASQGSDKIDHSSVTSPIPNRKPSNGIFSSTQPLADILRPSSLDDFIGQEAIVGEGGVLRTFVERRKCPSFILWGPSGVGKTTLARIVARECGRQDSPTSQVSTVRLVELSATVHGVNDCKKIFQDARRDKMLTGRRTFLFLDEVHRFNKAQQDVFLPHVERGDVVLIGATTENPSFKVNAALLSRCRVFVLKKLGPADIKRIIERGVRIINEKLDEEYGVDKKEVEGEKNEPEPEQEHEVNDLEHKADESESTTKPSYKLVLDTEVIDYLSSLSDGDGRVALNLLEMIINMSISKNTNSRPTFSIVGLDTVQPQLKRTHLLYDRVGDAHYDTISAFHKSVRGSDADAALFYLGRMLEAGEDPLYVARRMIRIASEDIGLADNSCLSLAVAAHQAVQAVGMPEADVVLAHCAVALAKAPKSVMVYRAYKRVKAALKGDPIEDVGGVMKDKVWEIREKQGLETETEAFEDYSLTLHNAAAAEVPLHLRNAPTKLMKSLGYGHLYKYNPDYVDGKVNQGYMPHGMEGIKFLDEKHLGDCIDPEFKEESE